MSERSPTTDLYFLHACGDWERRWWRRRPVVPLGANSFLSGDTMLLVRRDDDALMEKAIKWPGRLIYLIDDDIAGAAESHSLPADYRRRLMEFDRRYHIRLLRRADVIMVPSAELALLFENDRRIAATITRIDPYWPLPIADQRHFATLNDGAPVKILHLGSGSHAGGLAALVPAITRLLRDRKDFTFTYFAKAVPEAFAAHGDRTRRVSPMPWRRYRRWLARQRFHLAVYPLDDMRFDRARSSNKLIEHGIVGAVGIYPEDWLPAQILRDAAFLAPKDPSAWGNTIAGAVGRRESLPDMAARAGQIVAAKNDPATQRYLWQELLGIGPHSRTR